MSGKIAGIDLGTTNSEIALALDGRLEVVRHDGEAIMPSVVGLDADGTLLVGTPARNQLALRPDRTVRSIKRRMGTDGAVSLSDRTFSPPEISAILLKELVRRASAAAGDEIRRVVITVPAFFQDAQRQATRDAGEIAGLEVVRIVNEPTAAVLAYGGGKPGQERLLLVYDLGGGTFDVSVVADDGEMTEVLASHGDVHLGGDDFDVLLMDHLAERIASEHGVDPRDDARTRARLLEAAESAKHRLTEERLTRVREEFLARRDSGEPVHIDLEVARDAYEELIADLVERTLDSVHRALEAAGRSIRDVDDILLVGGSTRTPYIIERLHDLTGIRPRRDLHPDLSVALGAAALGARLAGEAPGRVLVDVTPYSFGPSALALSPNGFPREVVAPVIERGTPLPVTRSESFYTALDNQEAWDVRIFQGESEDPRENILVGRFRAGGLSPVPAESEIICKMSLGLDGILTVEVIERCTGLSKKVTIERATSTLTGEALEEARKRTAALWEEGPGASARPADVDSEARAREVWNPPAEREADPASPLPEPGSAIESLRTRAQRLFAKCESLDDRIAPEDREELESLERRIGAALDGGDLDGARELLDEVDDIVHYVEET